MKFISLILFLFPFVLYSQETPGKKGLSYSGSGFMTVSFFENDPRITGSTSAGKGFGFNFRGESVLMKDLGFMFGAEFNSQSQTFSSYYFAPGHSTVFDKIYNYGHTVSFYEISLPLFFRIQLVKKADDKTNSAYLLAGWSLKYILAAKTRISSFLNGDEIFSGRTDLTFENHPLGRKTGNQLLGGLGIDRKIGKKRNSFFLETIYHYGLSRYRYEGNNGTNEVFFKNSNMTIGIGYRF